MTIKTIKSAAKAYGFYDMPLYMAGSIKPDYYNLFSWSSWGCATKNAEGKMVCMFGGALIEGLFNTIDKKIAYLQGVFEDLSEGHGIINGKSYLQFANSANKVERCKKWINEVALFMCENEHISSNNYLLDIIKGGVIRHEITYITTPICHRVDLQPKVVDFIQNYELVESIG